MCAVYVASYMYSAQGGRTYVLVAPPTARINQTLVSDYKYLCPLSRTTEEGVVEPVVLACGDWLRERPDSSLLLLSRPALAVVWRVLGVEMERSREIFRLRRVSGLFERCCCCATSLYANRPYSVKMTLSISATI